MLKYFNIFKNVWDLFVLFLYSFQIQGVEEKSQINKNSSHYYQEKMLLLLLLPH